MDDVKRYYDETAEKEWNRLNNPYSSIEFNSTMYLIDKYFPKTGHVLDVGAGPGRYSLELLRKGYQVSLLDISKNELVIAKIKIQEQGYTAESYHCKSALELDFFEDESFDSILIMGPLYHLHSEEDRHKVLTESKRILKKGGTALISYINTWGVLKASVREFPDSFEEIQYFDKYIEGDLKFTSGESFTDVYFTIPKIAIQEVEKSGFDIISYAGAESFLSGLNMQMVNLYTYMPKVYENYLAKASEYCELPQYRDATEHLHIIAKRK